MKKLMMLIFFSLGLSEQTVFTMDIEHFADLTLEEKQERLTKLRKIRLKLETFKYETRFVANTFMSMEDYRNKFEEITVYQELGELQVTPTQHEMIDSNESHSITWRPHLKPTNKVETMGCDYTHEYRQTHSEKNIQEIITTMQNIEKIIYDKKIALSVKKGLYKNFAQIKAISRTVTPHLDADSLKKISRLLQQNNYMLILHNPSISNFIKLNSQFDEEFNKIKQLSDQYNSVYQQILKTREINNLANSNN